jgi:mono/diheme cytochrome c family protein
MRSSFALAGAFVMSVVLAFGQDAPAKIKKVTAAYTPPASGVEMFKTYCASCHGVDGTGTGPAASALKKAPANLTLLAQNHKGKFPKLEVIQFIKGDAAPAAHGSRDMPMWGEVFKSFGPAQDQIVELRVKNLAEYIEGMQKK